MLIQLEESLKERLQKLFVIIIMLKILIRVTCQIYYRQFLSSFCLLRQLFTGFF